MKTFKRTSLPQSINYNGETYTPNMTSSAQLDTKREANKLKSQGEKVILVEVLSKNLRGKKDLYNLPYKPTKWIFTKKLNK